MIRHEIRKEDLKAWRIFKIKLALIVIGFAIVSAICLSK
ncbi:hypothetical protein PRB90_gp40 [Klebsiella phage BUCT610]|jgi:hypothetical protein|nr:hypothetical protein PRB90_gp40 [Klebsiella phage BUCT610]QWX10309.1 hypothetical protein [Klebsiella phage BUCT610]